MVSCRRGGRCSRRRSDAASIFSSTAWRRRVAAAATRDEATDLMLQIETLARPRSRIDPHNLSAVNVDLINPGLIDMPEWCLAQNRLGGPNALDVGHGLGSLAFINPIRLAPMATTQQQLRNDQ